MAPPNMAATVTNEDTESSDVPLMPCPEVQPPAILDPIASKTPPPTTFKGLNSAELIPGTTGCHDEMIRAPRVMPETNRTFMYDRGPVEPLSPLVTDQKHFPTSSNAVEVPSSAFLTVAESSWEAAINNPPATGWTSPREVSACAATATTIIEMKTNSMAATVPSSLVPNRLSIDAEDAGPFLLPAARDDRNGCRIPVQRIPPMTSPDNVYRPDSMPAPTWAKTVPEHDPASAIPTPCMRPPTMLPSMLPKRPIDE